MTRHQGIAARTACTLAACTLAACTLAAYIGVLLVLVEVSRQIRARKSRKLATACPLGTYAMACDAYSSGEKATRAVSETRTWKTARRPGWTTPSSFGADEETAAGIDGSTAMDFAMPIDASAAQTSMTLSNSNNVRSRARGIGRLWQWGQEIQWADRFFPVFKFCRGPSIFCTGPQVLNCRQPQSPRRSKQQSEKMVVTTYRKVICLTCNS